MISESPLYHAVRTSNGPVPVPATPQALVPPFPTSINTAFAQAIGAQNNGLRSGYVTPVPATPLSAALGPAVQATVASTPTAMHAPPEYFHAGGASHAARTLHERTDTVMQPSGYSRR